jgi:alpha-tubulin suppressor-like RCC1 family protein
VVRAVSGLGSGVAEVKPGVYHTCAVTTAGAAKCWGHNDQGQLGDGTGSRRYAPVNVVGLTSGVIDIAPGHLSTCALTAVGGVKCWGDNPYGELGDGTTTRRYTPVDVIGLGSGVAEVVSGHHSTCALTVAGAVKCWGYGGNGEIGDGSWVSRTTPRLVSGLSSGVVDISAGQHHFCAVTSTGAAKCWGYGAFGQLGENSTASRNVPVNVVGLSSGVASISGGIYQTCALTTSGGVKCWGHNNEGQLGDGTRTRRTTPVDVSGLTSGVVSMSIDHSYTGCAVTTGGKVKCWGYNAWGQLGDGTNVDRITPVDLYNADGVERLSTNLNPLVLPGSSYSPLSPSFALSAPTSNRVGDLSFHSSRTSVATVNAATGQVTIVGSGRTILSAVQGGTGTHRVGVSRVTLNVRSACAGGGLCDIGETGPGGGKVFYDAGSNQSWGRYLEVAPTNAGGSAAWLDAIAAADAYTNGGNSDWVLPTSSEIGHLYTNRIAAGFSSTSTFWTATADDATNAFAASFADGSQSSTAKTTTLDVRAIRAFAPKSECELGISCVIGDTGPGGGKVFFVDTLDEYLGFDYLEVAPSDSTGAWCDASNAATSVSAARANDLGSGISNTQGVLAVCDTGAASSARDHRGGGLTDWFLPTIAEMAKIRDNLPGVLSSASYWTSYQSDSASSAVTYDPSTGATTNVAKSTSSTLFRPIRAFVSSLEPSVSTSLTGFALPSSSYNYGTASFATTAPTSLSSGITTYTSSNPGVATIHPYSGRVTIVAHGSTTFTATQEAWGPFVSLTASQNFTVNKGTPVLTGLALPGGPYRADDPNFTLVAPTTSVTNGLSSSGAITYSSSNTAAATIDSISGEIDLVSAGATTITATQAAQGSWNVATQSITLTVGSLCKDGGACRLGDEGPGGGTIFFVDSANSNPDVDFMEIAPADAGTSDWVGASALADGYANSDETDWRLASKAEMELAVTNLGAKGILLPLGSYWTSSSALVTSSNGSGTQDAFGEFVTGPQAQSSSNEWQYLQIPATRDAATLLSDWDSGNEIVPDNNQWDNNLQSNGNYPFVQKVTSTATATSGGTLTGAELLVHPDNSAAGVGVAWKNTLGYPVSVDVSATLKLAYPANNTDGVTYHLQRGLVGQATHTVLASGEIAGGSTSAVSLSATGVVLAAGDSLYVVVGNNGVYYWDHTILDFEVVPSTSGAYVVDSAGSSSVTGVRAEHPVRAIRSWQRRGSCQEIKTATGTNANGVYAITMTVNGVVTPTEVYCLMDSAVDGGGWTLAMKAAQSSTSFGYFANYWTTANTLNPSDISLGAGDAKYDTFNHLVATDMLAIFPDVDLGPLGATERGSIDGQNYGWTWKQTVPNGPKTPLAIFQGPDEQFIGDALNYSGFNQSVWTRQRDIRFYGFNWNDNRRARWGFGWNENGGGLWPNGAKGSDDASGGIGLSDNGWSAGDVYGCCSESIGLNRSMAVQIFVR